MELELRIDGVVASLDIAPNESLLSLLRREGHCSVKQGCETGDCGACTVLVDGVPRPACVMLAAQAGGCTVSTVESLGSARKLHPLQQAFIEMGAAPCGFCTPGMLLSAYALLQHNPAPTESEVRDALSGNLCRCTGYARPVQAVLRAAAILRGAQVKPLEYQTFQAAEEGQGTAKTDAKVQGGKTEPRITIPMQRLAGPLNSRAYRNHTHTIERPVSPTDALKKVTGLASFAADFKPHQMLYGRILTSPHAHAVIRNIDTSKAKALPGVHAVLTYKDVPRIPFSSVEYGGQEETLQDQFCLDYVVRHVGDRVALVAAEMPEIAEHALSLIEVEYEVQPAIFDPRQALDANAPRLHTESESHGIFDAAHNIAARVGYEQGNVDQGFQSADLIVEGEYSIPLTQATPLETHTVVTCFDEDDRLVVYTGSQAPHHVRRALAQALDVPLSRIHVIRSEIGGGFGIRQELLLEPLCALLTIATNRPVLLTLTRTEEFTSSRVQQQSLLRLKTGVRRDGTLVANQLVLLTSTGAYGTHPLIGQRMPPFSALSLYPCPNLRFAAEVVYTNLPPSGAYHGYGSPQEFFALESHMDEIARQLGMDALDLRRKNWIKTGDAYPLYQPARQHADSGPRLASCGLAECLRIVEEKLRWKEKRGGTSSSRQRRGIGIALSCYGHPAGNIYNGAGVSGAMIRLNEDGSFDLFAGTSDAGNGYTTLLAQMAAEVLGVPVENIQVHSSDTDIVPYEIGASGPATLYASGGAVLKAAEQLRRQILAVAGRRLKMLPENLLINAGIITTPTGERAFTIAEIATYTLFVEGRQIMSTATWKAQQEPVSFAALGVEVEVDSETGGVRVLKAISAVDAGYVINPLILEGQLEGGMARGLGSGLCEEVLYDQKGALLTTSLRDYHIYGALEMPELQTYLIETHDPTGPAGVKAVAELPPLALGAAIANAVADAVGVRIRQLPLTPERILHALHAKTQAQPQTQTAKP
ncbi:MAG: molybdopterin-dependent oxidoreductase [Ktedonobacteraceae bacterium]|nr:molybdopterin-dependent oxidoreductase [Ktedonobacteraceae bacterium]